MKRLPTYVLYPIVLAVVGILLLQVPAIGLVVYFLVYPLVGLFDYIIPGVFTESGQEVAVGFFWIMLKTPGAWLFFLCLFFLAGLTIGVVKYILSQAMPVSLKRDFYLVLFSTLFIIIVPLALLFLISEYEQHMSTAPAENRFVCADGSKIEIYSDNVVREFHYDKSERLNWETPIGRIDVKNKEFIWELEGYEGRPYSTSTDKEGDAGRYKSELSRCKNSDGMSLFDLYPENIINKI